MATNVKPVADQAALARVGKQVSDRLEANEAVFRLPTDKAQIYAVGNFLSPQECSQMMAMIDAVAQPSQLHKESYVEAFRTSYSGNLDPRSPFVKSIVRRVDDLMGINSALGEALQGQRYAPGQQFKAHYDWFDENGGYWAAERKRGGQRGWTAMAYLNAVEEGGGTCFTDIGLMIDPTPGALLIWNNANPDGTPNPATIHAGTPPVKGTKYIFTRWYRTRRHS